MHAFFGLRVEDFAGLPSLSRPQEIIFTRVKVFATLHTKTSHFRGLALCYTIDLQQTITNIGHPYRKVYEYCALNFQSESMMSSNEYSAVQPSILFAFPGLA